MLLLLALLQVGAAPSDKDPRPLHLASEASAVSIPREESASIDVDGRLDEPAWSRAARLGGFHQYRPVDGRPAEERTEILIWYSPQALYIGILAYARDAGAIRATLADRDNIGSDDRVTIFLDTFLDRRRAFFFAVNPLGVQQDGVRTDGVQSAGDIFGGDEDTNPDYYFESRGRVTDDGYVVEVRIPFKSLRFPGGTAPQRWGFNVLRAIPASGYEDTWTGVRRAGGPFLSQAGVIEGLSGLERGVVVEAQPFVTLTATGERGTDDRFSRDDPEPSAGANARLGFSQLSLDATINPDFSQIESDVGLVTVNERFALFIPEKRPFFLEGIELFSTPGQLVYTRRIVDPVAGGKLTGKLGPFGVAHLTTYDELADGKGLFNITRLRRDFGGSSVTGVTFTDFEAPGSAYNRVLAGDAHIVFSRIYFFEAQLGRAWTRDAIGGERAAPIWKAELDRTGRAWGFNYHLSGLGEEFESRAGFVPRTGIVQGRLFNRISFYGERGALLESVNIFSAPHRVWMYDDFGRRGAIEGVDELNTELRVRGGWELEAGVDRSFVRFAEGTFEDYEVDQGPLGIQPYVAPNEQRGLLRFWSELETPVYRIASASFFFSRGAVAIFDEGSEGRETRANLQVALRPTPALRVEASTVLSRINRDRDGSEFARTLLPRLKVEYQLTRSMFVRVVGEHRSERRAPLEDARTGEPLLISGVPTATEELGSLRMDWLISYEPTPGTVAFLGYGSTHDAPDATRVSALRRSADGIFVKLAYQFRR
ncbi:MAG TPA: DUF5916 domain-containing protein [Gemmatimonadaceae bacterium]|nr:DUF5916 domain-containing protein [Gemmatimonadaceae bacterium]